MIDLKALKALGQNFLVDPKAHARIVASIDPKADDTLIEIGPGTGLLTRHLLNSPLKKLIAFEIDSRAVPLLRLEFAAEGSRFEVREQDFLTVNTTELSQEFETQFRVAGNIPYYITSPILFKLIDERASITDATLLVQLEVAERLVASAGTKAYGIPTVLANFFAEVRFLFKVPAGAFRPVPKVDSAVIQVNFEKPFFARTGTDAPPGFDETLFRKLVRGAFAMRRKTLRNNMKSLFGPDGIASIELAGLTDLLALRAEALSIAQFVQLTDAVHRYSSMNE